MKIKRYIPNILSSIRLFSPFVLTPLIMAGNYIWAIIALSVFLLTDAFDGFLARKWHVESELGAKIDAVADKIIVLSLLLPILFMNHLLFITLLMEAGISSVNILRKIQNGKPKTLQVGRIKMILLSLFIGFNYLGIVVPISKITINILFAITLLFQGISLILYFKELIQEEKKRNIANNYKEKNDNQVNDLKKAKQNDNVLKKEKELNNNSACKKEELEKLKDELINNYEFNNEYKTNKK